MRVSEASDADVKAKETSFPEVFNGRLLRVICLGFAIS